MAFSSLGSLGLRGSLRLDMEEDLPRLKKERQLPTGDFLDLIGGLFLLLENGGGKVGKGKVTFTNYYDTQLNDNNHIYLF